MRPQNPTQVSTPRAQTHAPLGGPELQRATRPSRKIYSNTPSKSPLVIRGQSNDRNTFGIGGYTDSDRKIVRDRSNTVRDNSAGSNRCYRVSETTLNRTSSPLAPVVDRKVTSRPLNVNPYKNSESDQATRQINFTTRTTSKQQTDDRFASNQLDMTQGDFYETDFDTNQTYSTLYTQRHNGIEVMTGSIQINEATKVGSKPGQVPPLDYQRFTDMPISQPSGTNNIVQNYNGQVTRAGNGQISQLPSSTPVRIQTNAPSFNFNHPKQSNALTPNLTESSPYKQVSVGTNYIPGTTITTANNLRSTGTAQNVAVSRLVASPIRTSAINGTTYQTATTMNQPYRVVSQPQANYIASSPYRVEASPIRTTVVGNNYPTAGSYSPINIRTAAYSPIHTTAPIYTTQAPVLATRTPSIAVPTYVPQPIQPIYTQPVSPPRVDNNIVPSFKPGPPRSIFTPIYTDPKQHGVSNKYGPVPPHKNDPYIPPSGYKTPRKIEVIGAKVRTQRMRSKIVELPEADLSNPTGFFNNHLVGSVANKTALDLRDPQANELSMNDDGTLIYATGLGGTHVVGVNGPQMTKEDFRPDRPGNMVECIRNDDLIIQDPVSNDLYKLDGILGLERQIDGLPEAGRSNEDLHHYRHSLDYAYLLWRSGQDNLSIVDVELFECVDVIKKFWTFNNLGTMPVCATATVNADRILGASKSGPNNNVVHYYQENGAKNISFSRPIEAVFVNLYKITSMDTSYDEKVAFVGGRAILNAVQGSAIIMAVEFNEGLREISSCLLTDLDYGNPNRIQRVSGTNLLVVGCDRHYAILDFRGSLVQIARIPNVHNTPIVDFVMRGKFLYSKALNDPVIKSVEFNAAPIINVLPANNNLPVPVRSSGSLPITELTKTLNNFSSSSTQKFEFPGMSDLHKIEVSGDGFRLFAGGKGLHRFDSSGGSLRPLEIDTTKDINYFGIKSSARKELFIQEPTTNNLVVLTESLEFIKLENGKQQCIFPQYHWRNPRFSGEDGFFIWFCGTSSIAIVDTNSMIVTELAQTLPSLSPTAFGLAMRCVAKENGRVVLVAFVIENTWSLAYYEKGMEPDNHLLTDVLPSFGRLYSMEISADRNTWFAGGTSTSGGVGVISALNFNRGLGQIKTSQLDSFGMKVCSQIKRMPNRDDLVVGGFGKILLMSWTGKDFIVNSVIENLHSNIALYDNRIYSVCKDDAHISQTILRQSHKDGRIRQY